MPVFFPEIYKRFATPLTLDLGPSTQAIEATRVLSGQIKQITSDVLPGVKALVDTSQATLDAVVQAAKAETLNRVDARSKLVEDTVLGGLPARLADVNQHTDGALAGLKQQVLDELKSHVDKAADDIVVRVGRTPLPMVTAQAWPLVRALTKAMVQALDDTPAGIYKGKLARYKGWLSNDAELHTLHNALPAAELAKLDAAANGLRQRYEACFDRFRVPDQAVRAARLQQMTDVLHELAQHLK